MCDKCFLATTLLVKPLRLFKVVKLTRTAVRKTQVDSPIQQPLMLKMSCHKMNWTLLHPIGVKMMTSNIALLTWERRSRLTYRQVIPLVVSHLMMKKCFMLPPEKASVLLRRLTLTRRQGSTVRQKTKIGETLARLSSKLGILCILCEKKEKNQSLMQLVSGLPSKLILPMA